MIPVSVIIPIYNMREYLPECLDSVIGQTLPEIEILCIDDGSTDGTRDILECYSSRSAQLRVFYCTHKGPGAARNLGISEAKGKYVCMMDADDMYPDTGVLQMLYEMAERQQALVCGGNITNLLPDGRREKSMEGKPFESEGFLDSKEFPRIYGQTRFLFRRDFLIGKGLRYPEGIIRFEDPPFVLKTILEAEKYYVTPNSVYLRRASYKKTPVSRDICIGIWKGILECVSIMRENDLKNLYKEEIAPLFSDLSCYYFPYAIQNDEELNSLLMQVDEVAYNWLGIHNSIQNNSDVQKLKEKIEQEINLCRFAKEIILYGAGKVAMRVVEKVLLDTSNICAVAETALSEKKNVLGVEVMTIRDALQQFPEALVVVAGNDNNSKGMEMTLKEQGFNNYLIMNSTRLSHMEILGIA